MTKRWMQGLLVATAIFTAISATAQTKSAGPALWQAKGVHGTMYFFGTVHLMKRGGAWETAKVKEAFQASDTLYLEIADIDPTAMAAMQPMVLKLGLDAEHPLSTKISKDDIALLDAAAKDVGQPGEQVFEPMRPWLVYITLSALPALKAGYQTTSGIDQVLLGEAKSAKKPVQGFETAEDQLNLLAGFPEKQQVELLHKTLIDLPKSVSEIDELAAAWASGDIGKIATLGEAELKEKYPDVYAALVVKRNERFTDKIASLLKDPATGTLFVAIGAAHFAGSDSVIKMLEAKGVTITRIE